MSIIRAARKERGFAIIDNSVLQDNRLSMRGLGLLVRLLSRPDNWETNSYSLSREFDCGREQIRTVLRELHELGYMRLSKYQNEKGQWMSQWFVFEEPEKQQQELIPEDNSPEPGNRVLGRPDAITKTEYKEPIPTIKQQNPRASLADGGGENFDAFWSAYPKKAGKDAAKKAFAKRKFDEQAFAKVMSALNEQKASEQWQKDGGQFIPHPATWLNQGRFDDELMGGGQQAAGVFSGAI